jgi:hypothetical protein
MMYQTSGPDSETSWGNEMGAAGLPNPLPTVVETSQVEWKRRAVPGRLAACSAGEI